MTGAVCVLSIAACMWFGTPFFLCKTCAPGGTDARTSEMPPNSLDVAGSANRDDPAFDYRRVPAGEDESRSPLGEDESKDETKSPLVEDESNLKDETKSPLV